MSHLKDKVILVTGATSGIGRATAQHFAEQGAQVVACARSKDAGASLQQDIGDACHFVPADVTDEDQVRNLVEAAIDTFGHLDFAFNNAGVFLPEPSLHEHDTDLWHAIIATNLTSIYQCMKHEVVAMRATPDRACVIINNASIVGHRGSVASGLAYTTAKHGVIGLTRQAAITYAGDNIRVNAVSPGPTMTAATAPGADAPAEEVNARIAALNPTGQWVPADQIARTIAFLCSAEASMINGHDIPLDGGQLAKL